MPHAATWLPLYWFVRLRVSGTARVPASYGTCRDTGVGHEATVSAWLDRARDSRSAADVVGWGHTLSNSRPPTKARAGGGSAEAIAGSSYQDGNRRKKFAPTLMSGCQGAVDQRFRPQARHRPTQIMAQRQVARTAATQTNCARGSNNRDMRAPKRRPTRIRGDRGGGASRGRRRINETPAGCVPVPREHFYGVLGLISMAKRKGRALGPARRQVDIAIEVYATSVGFAMRFRRWATRPS